MGFNVSGLIGAGAQEGLAELLQRQMVEQQLAERTRQFDEELKRRRDEDAQQAYQFEEGLGQRKSEQASVDARYQRDDDRYDAAAKSKADAAAYDATADANMAELTNDPAQFEAFGVASGKLKPIDVVNLRQRRAEAEVRETPEQKSAREMADYEGKKKIDAKYPGPDRAGRIDVRSVQSRGPNGEPGTKTMVFRDGTLSEEHWEPGNPSAGERKDFGDFKTLNEAFDNVEASFAQNSGVTGPIAGRLGTLAQAVPLVKTPEGFTDIKSKLAQAQNALLYLRSGKAISEPEFQRMMKELPSENDKGPDFATKLANARALMDTFIANRKGAAGVPGGAAPAAGGQAPTHRWNPQTKKLEPVQ
jgi:hypothetical protein